MSQSSADALATSLLAKSGRTNGIWSVPHCGSGELVQSFWTQRTQNTLLIDAFDSSGPLLQSAQQKASAAGLLGRNIYVYPGSLSTMPYADNYVDMVVITGLTDADLANTSYAEIERVLCTGAKAFVGTAASEGAGVTVAGLTNWIAGSHTLSSAVVSTDGDGTFAVITKVNQIPGTDEWPMSLHGPDGNRVSMDQKVGWPWLPQWKAKPYYDTYPYNIAAGGRLYAAIYSSGWGIKATRIYNGQSLWTKSWSFNNLATSYSNNLYAGSDYVCFPYSISNVYHVLVVDGETGNTRSTIDFPPSFYMSDMLLSNDIIYAIDGAHILAYNVKTSALLYNKPLSNPASVGPVMSGSNIYTGDGQYIYCYDAATGTIKWTGSGSHTVLTASKYGVAGLTTNSGTAYFLSANDGSVLINKKLSATSSYYSVNDNLNYTDPNFLVNLNQVYQPGFSGGGCGNATLSPWGLWSSDFTRYRTSCGRCPFPSDGLIYFVPRDCNCAIGIKSTYLAGTAVEASLGTFNPQAAISGTQRLEPGEAFTNWTPSVTTDNLDWATYRANNNRSAFSPTSVPSNPGLLWTHSNSYPFNSYRGWDASAEQFDDTTDAATEHRPTPAVTAGNYIYYAGSDGVVNCLASLTGNLIWSYPTGGYIFTAPTVWNGGVYVGSGDGYVYCLEAHTGRLRWRFRAAPAVRKRNDWGHLMSTWPVMTGVLVSNGYAYFCSGIYAEYGSQAYKVDATTGTLIWANTAAGSAGTIYQPHGLSPQGTMTIAGNQLWVRGLYYNAAFDIGTGSMSMFANGDGPDLYTTSGVPLWDGVDIGVYGHYVVCGGRPLYPSDMHVFVRISEGGDSMRMIKVDPTTGLPSFPTLHVTSPASCSYRLGFWTNSSFNGCDDSTLIPLMDGEVASGTAGTYTRDSSLLFDGDKMSPYWPNANKYPSWSEVYVGCSNGYFYTNSSAKINFQPTSGSPWIPSGSAWTKTPAQTLIYNGISIDRKGNFVTTMVNGDVAYYGKPRPIITWNNPADITYGTALSAVQLSASASVPSTFVYTPPAGTVLSTGTSQTLSVVATPTDMVTYDVANQSVAINVLPATLTVTANNAARVSGTPNPTFTATYTGLVNGDTPASIGLPVSFACPADNSSPYGFYPITPSGPASTANYSVIYQSGTLGITQSQTISFGTLPVKTYGDAPFALNATASSGLPVSYVSDNPGVASVSGSTVTVVEPGVANITASQPGNLTYAPAPNVTQALTVISSSSNADLAALVISSGTFSPAFSPSVTSYTQSVPNSISSVIVTPTLSDTAATVHVTGGSPLVAGTNTITVAVTARNGITVKNYSIVITRAPCTNAYLSGLSLNTGSFSPSFSGTSVFSYTASVANGVTGVTVTATPADSTATVRFTGTSGFIVGSNTLTVTVTAQDGINVITYTVVVVRAGNSNNANLANMTLSSGTLSPVFNTNTTSYTASVPYNVTSMTVTPTLSDSNATIHIVGGPSLKVGNTTITVAVTAQNGTDFKNYKVVVTRAAASSNASLSNLVLSSGTLCPAFSTSGTSYTASVSGSVTSVTVTPTLSDTTATVQITGGSALATGTNTISVAVTAQDGVTVMTYTVVVTRAAASSNANLSNLTLSAGTLKPAFSSGSTSYSVLLLSNTIAITPALSDTTATVQVRINGGAFSAVSSGGASSCFALNVGDNPIEAMVTAADNVTTKSYIVIATRLLATDLSALTVTGTDSMKRFAVTYWRYHNAASSAIQYESSCNLACTGWCPLVTGADIQESILNVNGNVEQVQAVTTKCTMQLGCPFFLHLKIAP